MNSNNLPLPSWDQYFISMAYLAALRSKDESTKIGAVIVGQEHQILSMGCNSFPRGIDDHKEERQVRPEKYFWIEHAERNSIFNAARSGISVEGSTMYTNGTPCADCGRAIIQSGIREVVIHKQFEEIDTKNPNEREKWVENARRTKEMFSETGLLLREYDGKILDILSLRNGKILDFS